MINKACYIYGSCEHLQYDYDQRVVKPVWNNTRRVNHKNFANKFTHPYPKKRFVLQLLLTSEEARLKFKELVELCIKLPDKVLDLDKTKTTQAKEIAELKKRVEKLKRKRRSKTPGMNLFKIGTSRRKSLGEDDASKQGRNLKQSDEFSLPEDFPTTSEARFPLLRIERLTNELEELKKEKEGLDSKLTCFQSASKDLDTLLGSQSDLQNSDSSVSENGESSESIMSKPMIKFVKAADSPTVIKTNKDETVRKPSVKYAEMYRKVSKSSNVRGNQRN
nr:hypothetical protein [Tanacetum cinerariifolium]